jgi:hypothetical protein
MVLPSVAGIKPNIAWRPASPNDLPLPQQPGAEPVVADPAATAPPTAAPTIATELHNEVVEFPKVGDKTVKMTYLTRHTSLGKLIKAFNESLREEEKQFEVDTAVVHIRDAIAHGRLVATKTLPFRLWKFGPHKGENVEIEFSEELTTEWLKSTTAMIDGEKQKVLDCFNARGYQGLH